MKYRMLTREELIPLEEDLKAFLIVNGIDAEKWEEINKNDPEKAGAIVGSFSDAVLQIVYEKLEFLEFRNPESCMVFRFGQEELELISIQRKDGSAADLSNPVNIHSALQNHASELTWFKSARTYKTGREAELHAMLESGCVISSVDFWNALKQVVD